MRRYKTSKKKRDSYVYYFADGTTKEVSKQDVGEHTLQLIHEFDDEAVDASRREDYHVPIHYGDSSVVEGLGPFFYTENSPLDLILRDEEAVHKAERTEKLRQAMKELTPKQQLLIKQVFFEGKNQSAIAKEEGVSKMAITNRLKKIYAQLFKKIQK
ncbi:sigma-70 family RNA polymerase sigma factor [Lactococcus lactis]|uniref:sigma-70 family RNA polymerase sigma factor n=1 Tax=Lactococcus lactis TaxID=1358 RepID=UPI0028BD5885|nr:sigma-70 family RNA polymerase sigma factor [Lactococcus lactis]WNN67621.1 sigma-70 family RNA polymerase sigma factor [Lactococcus lactis]WPK09632.1 sigma-70 family RNA polymerase sigma factor [Lactococcus lactis]